MRRGFGYIRVSGEEQEEDGYGLDVQESAIRAYCAANDIELVRLFDEGAHSARKEHYSKRPVLTEMRRMLKAGAADVAVLLDVSRLSRRAPQTLILVEESREAGCYTYAFAKGRFEDDPIGRMVLFIEATMAEMQGDRLIENTQAGLRQRVKSGMMLVGSSPPFGYEWHHDDRGRKTQLVFNEDQVPIMRRIFRQLIEGRSARQVAIALNADGIPSPRNGNWSSNGISMMVRNPVYKGTPRAYRFAGIPEERMNGGTSRTHGAKQLSEGEAAGAAPALVTEPEWEAAVARVDRGRIESPRNDKNPTEALLRGLVRCGVCGKAVSTQRERAGGPPQAATPHLRLHPPRSRQHDALRRADRWPAD